MKKKSVRIVFLIFIIGVLMMNLFLYTENKCRMSERSRELLIAIEENDSSKVHEILKDDPRCVNSLPTTAPELLHVFLELPEVSYPLQMACLWGRYDIANILLENGADCNLSWKGIWGSKSPLSCAVISNTEESKALIELLLTHGADKTYIDECGKSAYDYAVENGNIEFQELLK